MIIGHNSLIQMFLDNTKASLYPNLTIIGTFLQYICLALKNLNDLM